MDKKYLDLFKKLAQATAVTAEQVMEYDESKNDTKGFETAQIMRNDYQALADTLEEGFTMSKGDAAKLLVATMIQANQLQDRIDNLKKAMVGYQTDLIPKLQEIMNKATNDEEAIKLAEEKFIIENEQVNT